jgi:hypothetical protein
LPAEILRAWQTHETRSSTRPDFLSQDLWQLSLETLELTRIASLGTSISGLDFHSNGTLFGVSDQLLKIHPATGAVTPIGDPGQFLYTGLALLDGARFADAHYVALADQEIRTGVDFGNAELTALPANTAPAVTTQPPTRSIAGTTYRYDVLATDADRDVLQFDLAIAPDGMTVHPTLGIVVWTPTTQQIGAKQVVLRVRDDRGGIALQQFTIDVIQPNAAPSIVSVPHTNAVVGLTFAYDANAQDANGDTLAYQLETTLAGMTIVGTSGLITWTPAADQTGPQNVTLLVTDGRGGETRQMFVIDVSATGANAAPVFTSTPRLRAFTGLSYGYELAASDRNGDSLTFTLEDGPAGMTIDGANILRWTPTFEQSATANHPTRIRVEDSNGASALQNFTITVASEVINDAPTIVSNPPLVAVDGREYVYDLAGD